LKPEIRVGLAALNAKKDILGSKLNALQTQLRNKIKAGRLRSSLVNEEKFSKINFLLLLGALPSILVFSSHFMFLYTIL